MSIIQFSHANGFPAKTYSVLITITVEQEVAIFHKMLTSYPKSIYKVRGTLVYVVKNPVLLASDLRWIKRNFTQLKLIPFTDSHLFPLNYPESTAQIINRCLMFKLTI